jgi:hypothetical protein
MVYSIQYRKLSSLLLAHLKIDYLGAGAFLFHKPNGDRAICHFMLGIFDVDLSQSLWTAPGNVEIVSYHVLSVRIDTILSHGPPYTQVFALVCVCVCVCDPHSHNNIVHCVSRQVYSNPFSRRGQPGS